MRFILLAVLMPALACGQTVVPLTGKSAAKASAEQKPKVVSLSGTASAHGGVKN